MSNTTKIGGAIKLGLQTSQTEEEGLIWYDSANGLFKFRNDQAGFESIASASSVTSALARGTHTGTQLASTISDFSTAADLRITAQAGNANGLATLDGSAKIPTSQLPGLAITTTNVVASEAAMIALTAEEGDIAIRTDVSKTFAHNGGVAGTAADWSELLTPTDAVTSVNGTSGVVVLDADDLSDAATTNKFVTAADITNLGNLSGSNSGDNAVNSLYSGLVSNVSTNLSYTAAAAQGTVVSSDGTDAVIPAATGSLAGLLTGDDKTKLDAITGTNTGDEAAASDVDSGIVELATIAEVDTGTDAVRAITPAGLAGSALQSKVDGIASGATAYTDADAKAAAVADSITDTITDVAPSQNAVFDALALKLDASAKYTDAEAIAAPITGFTSVAGTVSASDSIFSAIQKLDGNIAASGSGDFLADGSVPMTGALNLGASGSIIADAGTDLSLAVGAGSAGSAESTTFDIQEADFLIPGAFVTFSTTAGDFYIWYNKGSDQNPAPGGTGFEVFTLAGEQASNVGDSTGAQVSHPSFTISNVGQTITITNNSPGAVTDFGNPSGAAFNISITQGTDAVAGGSIILDDGSASTPTHVWTATGVAGEGEWAAPAAGADDMGDHTATEDLKMEGFNIVNNNTTTRDLSISSASAAGASGLDGGNLTIQAGAGDGAGLQGSVIVDADIIEVKASMDLYDGANLVGIIESDFAASELLIDAEEGISLSLSTLSDGTADSGDIVLKATDTTGVRGQVIANTDTFVRTKDGTNGIEEEYIDSIAIAAGGGALPISAFTVADNDYSGMVIEYTMSDDVSGEVRQGTLRVANGPTPVVSEVMVESASLSVAFTVDINSTNLRILSNSTGSNAITMRADVKRFRK
jgi:hypothetical protein